MSGSSCPFFHSRQVREVVEEDGQDLFTTIQYSMVCTSAREFAMGDPGRSTEPAVADNTQNAEAARQGRWEFMLVAAPLAVEGGTGSPLNPLAIF